MEELKGPIRDNVYKLVGYYCKLLIQYEFDSRFDATGSILFLVINHTLVAVWVDLDVVQETI